MILDLLQTPLFIYSLIISLFIFAILYLWRKISGIENYMFILEKRINNIKKPTSFPSNNKESEIHIPNNVNENIRVADMIMNEVFNNITHQDNVICSNILECNQKESKHRKNTSHTKHNLPIVEHVTNKITENIATPSNDVPIVYATSVIKESTDSSKTEESLQPQISIISAVPIYKNTDDETSSITNSEKDKMTSNIDDDKFEIASTKSEIMNSIKLSGKKLLKLDLGKLKEYCTKLNVSTEGTKNQIIDRLLLL